MPLAYPIHERTLSNGLRVVISPDHQVPVVAVNLWVGVGSRHEQPGKTGFAHLFEHLMFQGSRNVASGEHFAALMAAGGRVNATTWFDRTNYFETVPSGALELALWLEADRQGYLLDAVNQENLDNQRDVVKEEKRQRYDNVPYGHLLIDTYAATFPEDHPYHHPTIGSMEDLDAASLEDVHAFFTQHYGPANSVLTLAGDVTVERGFELVQKYFGSLPPGASPPDTRLDQLPPLAFPTRIERVGDVPNDRLRMAWRLPIDPTDDYLATTVALDVISGLTISRFVETLLKKDQLVNGTSASALGLVDGVSLGFISLDVADGVEPIAVEEAAVRELDRFLLEGPTPLELEACLAQSERAYLTALAGLDERADLISHTTLLHHDANAINTHLDRLRALTADDVQAAAAAWLRPEQRATIAYLTSPAAGLGDETELPA